MGVAGRRRESIPRGRLVGRPQSPGKNEARTPRAERGPSSKRPVPHLLTHSRVGSWGTSWCLTRGSRATPLLHNRGQPPLQHLFKDDALEEAVLHRKALLRFPFADFLQDHQIQ